MRISDCSSDVCSSDLFQLGGRRAAGVAVNAVQGQVVGGDFGLFKQGGDQAVGHAAVADAFTHGVNARVVGLQRIVHHNAAVRLDAGAFGQVSVGPDRKITRLNSSY